MVVPDVLLVEHEMLETELSERGGIAGFKFVNGVGDVELSGLERCLDERPLDSLCVELLQGACVGNAIC